MEKKKMNGWDSKRDDKCAAIAKQMSSIENISTPNKTDILITRSDTAMFACWAAQFEMTGLETV
jgi:hypothetical protein